MKRLSMIMMLLFAGISYGQQYDRWNGLVIGETTPEQAIAKLGKPEMDVTEDFGSLYIQRLLTNDTGKPVFRAITFGQVGVTTSQTLTFLGGKLVSMDLYPVNTPASTFVSKVGPTWRLATDDLATDFENWDKPGRAGSETTAKTTADNNDPMSMGYQLIARSPKTFVMINVLPSIADMKRTSISEAGPYWGNIMSLSMISRTLERKPGEPDAGDGPIPAGTEVVMAPGSSITAETATGTITITAGKGLLRSYTWEGATRSVEMGARKERWYGSLGLAWPGPGDHWKIHNGITRGVLEEGQMRFNTAAEAMKWIGGKGKELPLVYRNDGLVVGFGKNLSRKQINVDVWQIYVGGKKPTALAGSQDAKIR